MTMHTYALHVSPVIPGTAGEAAWNLPVDVDTTVHEDDDSFIEWGEKNPGEPRHVVIEFKAPSHKHAAQVGARIFRTLVVNGVVNPTASCHRHFPVPYTVTSAAVWSAGLTPDGKPVNDLDWKQALSPRTFNFAAVVEDEDLPIGVDWLSTEAVTVDESGTTQGVRVDISGYVRAHGENEAAVLLRRDLTGLVSILHIEEVSV